ncbi:MAG: DUF2764 family protein [Candidatus Omnitrophota bacterium]|nr:DUF2764 family protein [Candidatus Omnitrophota bacterium]
MPAYYTYLISSLPLLNFSAKLPFSLEDFFTKCKNLIPEKEFEILRRVCEQDICSLATQSIDSLKQWANFEIALRNELVRARAGRKKIDPLKFLRLPDSPQAEINHLAMAAYRSISILEGEKILDQARWNFLEALSLGHYFDFDHLLVYGLKLKILERWDEIQKADKEHLLNAVV